MGERLWTNWVAGDLPEGPVAVWSGHSYDQELTQPDPQLQPVKDAAGFVHFSSGDFLDVPFQGRGGTAHKAFYMVFRVDGGSDQLLCYNGFQPDTRHRQPAVSVADGRVTVHWGTAAGPDAADITLPMSYGEWHSLVARRDNGTYYASIDGGPESSVTLDWVVGLSRRSDKGRFGYGLDWDLAEIGTVQLGLSTSEVDKLHGWAAAQYGVVLPPGHPYEMAAPVTEAGDWISSYVETPLAEWQAVKAHIKDNALAESNIGEPLDLTSWQIDFEDDFSTYSVGDRDDARPYNWWTGVHTGGAGDANTVRIGAANNDGQPFYYHNGDEAVIRMAYEKINGQSEAHWYGGVMTSVNFAGHGRTWTAPFYMEARFRSRAADEAGWAAFWTESINMLTMQTEPYNEIDIAEHYSSDPNGYHAVLHRHDPFRNWPGSERITDDSHASNYIRLNETKPWGPVDLWDDQYHIYGLMVEEDWTRIYFDGMEITRWPTTVETTAPQFILLDMALVGGETERAGKPTVDPATGEVSWVRGPDDNQIGIDYVRVYIK